MSDALMSGSWMRDLILGGQDGLVNVLGIAMGVSAATSDMRVLIAAGLAATFAESTSMGAVAYTSSLAQRDRYLSEEVRLRRQIQEAPAEARELLRRVYAAKGFEGQLLEQIIQTITTNEETWLQTVMREGLGLEPVDLIAVRRTSVIVTVAAFLGSLVPLWPFFILPRTPALLTAVGVSAMALFGVGAYEARLSVGDWRWRGVQMMLIGIGAAMIGFLIGLLFDANG